MKTFKNSILILILLTAFFAKAQENETAFHVKVVGKGEPILLFPGFSCTGDVWKDSVKELSKTHECHLFTFAGFGNVPAIETPWLATIKSDLEKYIQRKNLYKSTIIGHSMGGSLALWLAADHPEKFKQLIIVDGLPSIGALMIPNFDPEKVTYDNPFSKQQLEMKEEAFKQMATQMAAGMTLTKEKQPQIVSWIEQADRKTYVYGYVDLLKLDLREKIQHIKIPVTIMAAVSFFPKEQVEELYTSQYQKLAKKDILYVEKSAHFIMFDQLEWFQQQLQKIVH